MIRIPHPRSTILAGAAVLTLIGTAPTLAQQRPTAGPPSAIAASTAGRWLYDDRGEIVGSVKSVSADGRTATIVLGVYTLDNVRVVDVPAGALSVVNGRVTLRAETVIALNTRSRQ